MASNAPDIRDIVMAGGGLASESAHVPDTTTVGHIHLRVGGIPEAEAFYNGLMNFDVTARLPGATFYSTGQYHHHIATNTWESRGAPKRSGSVTGLASFDLLAKDQPAYDLVAEKMTAMGGKRVGSAVSLADPWGNLVQLRRV
jgi:catechol 2,3-dioxygenase